MDIILIRHGQTTENQHKVVQMPDAKLSHRGLQQAGLLAGRLSQRRLGRIISSDMTRAAQTAKAIAQHHQLPVNYSEVLHERNLGKLRGMRYEDIGFNFFAEDYAPEDGESWSDFFRRVDRAWDYILDAVGQCDGDLVVVTHGLVCRRIATQFLNIDGQPPEKWDNTSVTIFSPHAPFDVTVLNCTAHLKELDAPQDTGQV